MASGIGWSRSGGSSIGSSTSNSVYPQNVLYLDVGL